MDVLKPPIIRVGGRCYRRNPTAPPPGWKHTQEEQKPYLEDEEIFTCMENEDEECELDIKETDRGFSLLMEVPSEFHGVIIGRGGEKRKHIEHETQCQINIPRRGDQSNIIVIRGAQRKGVISAKTRIDVLVDSSRQKKPFTHFVSIPLNTTSIQDRFLEFKEDVLRDCDGTYGLHEAIFQKSCKLHLTITTLVLLSESEMAKARALLKQCKTDVIDPILQGGPLEVDIRGLEIMEDDPSQVWVLYGKVEPAGKSNKLQLIADSLMERFRTSGLARVDYDRVKIHVTLMNCNYWKDVDATEVDREFKKKFDARPLLEKFGDYTFGHHTIDAVHISQRGSYGDDGFYLPTGQIRF